MLKPAFVLPAPWKVRLGCGLSAPCMAFRENKRPDFCFNTFLVIMLVLLSNYCSQIAHSAELKALWDLEIWAARGRGTTKYS